ncbi:hypothetical protein MUK42_27433 [Musa troglodytarum]|uniref:Uncharacterized protein n=1 Tax=Musa troglodytarum TaxID=320322 RepID=A0A9E7FCG7_9LILI|nr:hypothetical protein MUK42_27433 [Musa troglodytarum]
MGVRILIHAIKMTSEIKNEAKGEKSRELLKFEEGLRQSTYKRMDPIQLVLGRGSAQAVASVSASSSSIPQPDLISPKGDGEAASRKTNIKSKKRRRISRVDRTTEKGVRAPIDAIKMTSQTKTGRYHENRYRSRIKVEINRPRRE